MSYDFLNRPEPEQTLRTLWPSDQFSFDWASEELKSKIQIPAGFRISSNWLAWTATLKGSEADRPDRFEIEGMVRLDDLGEVKPPPPVRKAYSEPTTYPSRHRRTGAMVFKAIVTPSLGEVSIEYQESALEE